MSIQQMRKTYSMAGFSEQDADPDPLVQFRCWFDQAQQPDLPDWVEINAMTLSTTDGAGHVTSRVVLLKGIESGKLCFFTNYGSTKGQQLKGSPHRSSRQNSSSGRAAQADCTTASAIDVEGTDGRSCDSRRKQSVD